MQTTCKLSCKSCKPTSAPLGCVDETTSCELWAVNGECEHNPEYMKAKCQVSCNTCGQSMAAATSKDEAAVVAVANELPPAAAATAAADATLGRSCHTAVEGEDCYAAVRWAMTDGIHANADWYQGLTDLSPLEEFQAKLHRQNASLCPEPCPAPTGQCRTAMYGDECYNAVTWSRNDGIYAHPEWFPELQAGSSSREEFQAHIHLLNGTVCPLPCMLSYPRYSVPTYLAPARHVMKGIAYGPSPLKRINVQLTNDDFMSDITGAQWADWGRES